MVIRDKMTTTKAQLYNTRQKHMGNICKDLYSEIIDLSSAGKWET